MAVGSNLDRYRTISRLGSGGMATVLLAEDELLGRQVALKRLSTEDVRGLSRLRREALLGASISHQNLVSIYDVVSSDDDGLVIVMEYVPGETLGEKLAREGRLAPAEALRILKGVAAGLDAIHQMGIVHRDVKPPNILLGSGGVVKLADLGIASVQDRTRITSAGTVLGSFRYMAPEQLRDAPITPAIDVYALAAVAFEAISGQKARREPNPMALAHAISTMPPPDLRESWSAAPPALATVLKRGLARDPGERPASAGELVLRLGAAFEPEVAMVAPRPAVARSGEAVVAAPSPSPRQLPPIRPSRPRRDPPAVPVAVGPPAGSRPAPGPSPRAKTRATSPRRRASALAALLLLGAAAVVLAVLLGGTNHPAPSRSQAAAHARRRPATRAARTSASGTSVSHTSASHSTSTTGLVASTAGSAAAQQPASTASATSPTSAVRTFYELAAAHRFSQAWALADPTFRSQLGGYSSFQGGQSGDRSITFDTLRSASQSAGSATVAVSTTSVRTDGTHHCQGTVDLRPGSSGAWVLHQIHISCS